MEIYENVQNMTFNEIQWAEKLTGDLLWKYHYCYSAVCIVCLKVIKDQ